MLPGGRPVADASARVDIASAWGVSQLPSEAGRSTSEILDALNVANGLEAVVIGGVDPVDISADALSQLLNTFVVSLEISHSAVTAIADVVLPVAAVVEKRGSYMDWQGKVREFDKAVADAQSRSDVRILSMLADALGAPINLPTVSATQREMESIGAWDGARALFEKSSAGSAPRVDGNHAILRSWRLLLDLGSLQEGEENLAGTARTARAHISASRAAALGVNNGDSLRISSDRGSLTLPASIVDINDDSVWVPRNSLNSQVIPTLGFTYGVVTVVKA